MKVTEIRRLAMQSTRYGWYDHGSTVAATCPLCRKHVVTQYSMWATAPNGKRLSKIQQARNGVADHLASECVETVNA